MPTTTRIHPCFWFDNQAEEAALLHRHLQELAGWYDHPLWKGRFRDSSSTDDDPALRRRKIREVRARVRGDAAMKKLDIAALQKTYDG
jgi:hypothetical protein